MSAAPDESGSREGETQSLVEFTEEEADVIRFLRNSKRVDLRWLTEEQKRKIERVLDGLHNGKKLSLLRISKEVGRSYMAIWGLCRALEIPTRSVAEADRNSIALRSKHKRTPFAGSAEEGAYMLGFKNGDLTAWQVSGTAVMVTSTTTHPAFAELFHKLFQGYSHVYQYPMYEEGKGYKWKLGVRLDNSFRFLLESAEEAVEQFASNRLLYMSWLAGLIDSDGNIHTSQDDKGHTRARVVIYNSNILLLKAVMRRSQDVGYEFHGPYLMKEGGTTTPFGIRYTKDLWDIALQQTESVQKFLVELPVRHQERVERKELALSLGRRPWTEIDPSLQELKTRIRKDVLDFCKAAEERYRTKKGEQPKAKQDGIRP